MRVAYVCTDAGIPVFGSKGASVHAQAVLRVLVSRGVEVHLLTPRVGGPAPAGLEDVHVHALPGIGEGDPGFRERAAQRSDAAVPGILRRLAGGGVLDLVYERYALWGASAMAWAQAAGVPGVLEVNAPLVAEQVAHRALTDRCRAETVAVSASSSASVVVCVSDEVAAWARGISERPERVHAVANGVDVVRIAPAPRPVTPAAAERFTVGFLGTLKPWHGLDTLVAALSILLRDDPSYRLLVVGDGPQASALREQAEASGVTEAMEVTGAVAPAAVPRLLQRMDVAVAPYPALEHFYFSPLKVYEYLAAGLPVVASRIGQVPAALDGGRLGVLAAPGDAAALAEAIASLRADPARRTALRAAGRAAAVEHHTWDAVVDRVLALVRSSAHPHPTEVLPATMPMGA